MWNKIRNAFTGKNSEQDDFIKRIRSLVIGEGMLNNGNISLLDYAITHLPKEGCVLEIGSYGGLSSNLIIYLLRKHNKSNPFFTCDAWIYEGFNDHLKASADANIDGRTDVSRADYSLYMKNAFMNSVRFLHPQHLPFSFHMTSALFMDNWNGGENQTDIFERSVPLGGGISLAYIDGGHSYEVAWNDFLQVSSHLVVGGFILLDDSADGQNFGSAQMMAQIKKDGRFRVIAKNPNYLVQKTGA